MTTHTKNKSHIKFKTDEYVPLAAREACSVCGDSPVYDERLCMDCYVEIWEMGISPEEIV